MQRLRTSLLTATLITATSAGIAAPASADSISFIRDGNVHLTTPDGSRTMAVTTTGGYSSASQSDDGRIIALRGNRFHLLSRWGDVLADFSPVAAGTAGSITLSGPFDPAISPDGTKVAYGFYVQYKSGDPDCGKPGGCQVGQLYTGTGYSRADGPVEWSEPGFRPQYSWTDPSWLDEGHTLLSSPTSAFVKESAIDGAGDDPGAVEWFSEGAVGNLGDGEANRQGTAVAFVGNTQGDRLLVYRLPARPASGVTPEGCLDAPASGKAWSSPSWSPDGERLVFAGQQGLYVAKLAGIAAACPSAASVSVTAFEPGATSPDWGPADLPGPRPASPGAGTPSAPAAGAPGGALSQPTGQPGSSASAPGAKNAITLPAASKRSALRKGIRVEVVCQGKTARAKATMGGATIGRGKGTCRSGSARLTIRLTAAGRKRLRAAKKATVTISTAGATAALVLR